MSPIPRTAGLVPAGGKHPKNLGCFHYRNEESVLNHRLIYDAISPIVKIHRSGICEEILNH